MRRTVGLHTEIYVLPVFNHSIIQPGSRTLMKDTARLRYLRVALVLIGIIFVGGIYPLMWLWPSGWIWHTGYSDYPMMIVGIYATLGVFLIMAARRPLDNLSLIWFTVWSSVVHSAIMAAQALAQPSHRGHLLGDIPALLLIAIILVVLTPRGERANALRRTG